MEKQRQSNFELLRLVCMLMVLACHANGFVNESDLIDCSGAIRVLINQFCLVCVKGGCQTLVSGSIRYGFLLDYRKAGGYSSVFQG